LERLDALLVSPKDRPGHDRRYAVDYTKITEEFNWTPRIPLA